MRKAKTRSGVLAASALSALLLAAHIHLHLGDYTAERGLAGLARMAGVCSAFGAMVMLVLETTLNAFERIFSRG